jgi:hypothetical protein
MPNWPPIDPFNRENTHEVIHTQIPHTIMASLNDIQSLIEIALYGGGDWIEKIRYPDDIKSRDEAVKQLWLADSYIEFKPYDDQPHPLTRRGLIDAIKAEPEMYESVITGEGDQIDADQILQLALFNEVVFG